MTILEQILKDIKFVAVLGHIRPDGSCLGSTLGLCNYLRFNYPDIRAAVYLEESSPKFGYSKGYNTIRHQVDDEYYELCACLDSGDIQRLGDLKHHLDQADKSLHLDHHVTNTRYGGTSAAPGEASSIYGVLLDQLDEGKLDRYTAKCLYVGIIHDTGVFKFSCTPAHTMEIVGKLVGKEIDFGTIIDNDFYRKTYIQNQILGRTLLESITFFDGRCIFSAIRQNEMKFYRADDKDTDGIIGQLRLTEGVEAVILLYETGPQEFKVNMCSQYLVDVGRVAAFLDGGDHVRATGHSTNSSIYGIINNLSIHATRQLDAASDGQR